MVCGPYRRPRKGGRAVRPTAYTQTIYFNSGVRKKVKTVNEIVQIITQVGFPIAACLGLWWDGRKREDRITAENNRREEKLLTALQESTRAQTENAAALTRLADAINNKGV